MTAAPRERAPARGRPRAAAAESHEEILDAVHDLLLERSVRDLTIESVAARAGVGKPTIYKWWPSKADLVMAMFEERLDAPGPLGTDDVALPVQAALRGRVRTLIGRFNGLFGKVLADLIAEGQADPAVLHALCSRHIDVRRAATVGLVREAIADGQLRHDLDAELFVDMVFGPLYHRLLLHNGELTSAYGDTLVDHAFRMVQAPPAG